MGHASRISTTHHTQADLLRAVSHPTRIAILGILREGEQCVCHMEAMLGLRQSYISQHLMVLREAHLVGIRRDGWNVFYHVTRPEVSQFSEALRALEGKGAAGGQRSAVRSDCPCPKCAKKPSGHIARRRPGAGHEPS
jgi:DNA-binding transcriptional ArsR family regulator